MGLDNTIERKLGTTRTDAMMVITVNNKTKKITYLSLPRIVLFKLMRKITKGCSELKPPIPTMDQQLLLTQLKLLNIPINHYVVFNFYLLLS